MPVFIGLEAKNTKIHLSDMTAQQIRHCPPRQGHLKQDRMTGAKKGTMANHRNSLKIAP